MPSAIPMDGPQASTLQNPLGLSMADKPDLAKLELDWNNLSFSVVPVCRTSTTPPWISTLFRLISLDPTWLICACITAVMTTILYIISTLMACDSDMSMQFQDLCSHFQAILTASDFLLFGSPNTIIYDLYFPNGIRSVNIILSHLHPIGSVPWRTWI